MSLYYIIFPVHLNLEFSFYNGPLVDSLNSNVKVFYHIIIFYFSADTPFSCILLTYHGFNEADYICGLTQKKQMFV